MENSGAGREQQGAREKGEQEKEKEEREVSPLRQHVHRDGCIGTVGDDGRGGEQDPLTPATSSMAATTTPAAAAADDMAAVYAAGEGAHGRHGRRNITTRLRHSLYPAGFRSELVQLIRLAWPVVFTQLLYYTIGTVAIIFAGRKGTIYLDVVALSTSVLSVTAITVANGLAGYCDTLFAQVFGSDEKHKLGIVLQKCLVIITLGICPCLALHINLQPCIQLLGHDSTVARLTEEYLMIHIPGTIAFFGYIVLSKYVQNQNKEVPIFLIALLANGVNIAVHAILLIWLETDVWGSAVAQCAAYTSLFVFTIIYIIGSGLYKPTWHGWSKECFVCWGPYFKLGIFGLLQHCIEFWAFEAGIILTGALGLQALGAQAIIYQFPLILYTIAWGIGLSGGIRVGQFLGAQDINAAKTAASVTLTVAVLLGTVICVLVASLRHQLPLIFTRESDLVELISSTLPIIAVSEIFDYLAGSMNGILRGCGRQAIGTAITIPAFGFVLFGGIPIMILTPIHIKGFWLAVLFALIFQALAGTIFLCRLNWKREVAIALHRIQASGEATARNPSPVIEGEEATDEPFLAANARHLKDDESPTKCRTKNKPVHLSCRTICYRILAFSLALSILLLGILVREVITPKYMETAPVAGNVTMGYANETSHL